MQLSCPHETRLGLVHCKAFHQQTVFTCPKAANKRAAILHNFSIRQFYCTWQTDRLKCASPALLDWVAWSRRIRTTHPLFLPPLCCRAWMSQTGLRLNWAEEFQHLACIYSLRSFGCSWWFPVDPQRVNCSGFGPRLPWTRRAWCSGAWLPQLGLSVKSSCDTQDWVIPSMRIRERERLGRSPHDWRGFGEMWELYVGAKSPHPLCEKSSLWREIPLFTAFYCTGWAIWNHYAELFQGPRDDKHLPQSAKPHSSCLSSPTKVPHYTASLTIGFNTRSSSGFDNGPTSLQWE